MRLQQSPAEIHKGGLTEPRAHHGEPIGVFAAGAQKGFLCGRKYATVPPKLPETINRISLKIDDEF